jgi:hypothetical protein
MLGGCASKYVNRTWVRVDGRQAPQKRLDADLAFCNAQTGRLQMSQPNLSNAQLDDGVRAPRLIASRPICHCRSGCDRRACRRATAETLAAEFRGPTWRSSDAECLPAALVSLS